MGDFAGSKLASLTVLAIGLVLTVMLVASIVTRSDDTLWHPPMVLECEGAHAEHEYCN